jgi:mannose-6-phosphate isomerase-like protein (cupin superfamily)
MKRPQIPYALLLLAAVFAGVATLSSRQEAVAVARTADDAGARAERVIVLKGAARIRFEDGIVEMKVGDFVNIPAHKKHRVEWTTVEERTIWLAVHYTIAKDAQ